MLQSVTKAMPADYLVRAADLQMGEDRSSPLGARGLGFTDAASADW